MDSHLKKNKNNKLPIIYPIVIYTGHKKYNSAKSIFDLFENKELGRKIFLEPYKLVNLQNITDGELKEQIWFGLMAKIFKNIRKNPIEIIREVSVNLVKIDDYGCFDLIYGMVKYLVETKEVENKEEFFQEIVANLTEKSGGKIMTLADRLRNEGRKEGMQQGKLEALEIIPLAIKLLQNNEPVEKIAKVTGFSVSEISKLKNKIT